MTSAESTTAAKAGAPGRVGVLIANLGTPDGTGYWPMRRYLRQFLSDRFVIDLPRWKWLPILHLMILTKRPFTSGAAYGKVWNNDRNEGPLRTITRDQAHALAARLHAQFGDHVVVDYCMRYGNPGTASRARRLQSAGCSRILFFPLYPQYAGATTETACQAFDQAMRSLAADSRVVPAYFDHPLYIAALAQSIRNALTKSARKPDAVLASYHGMPQRYRDNGDPYYDQCLETSRLLGDALGPDGPELITAFQSKFGPEEWLKPYTVQEVARLARAGKKRIIVIAPGFSADCLETLEEIEVEIREAFVAAGGEEFMYVPCLNTTDAHTEMMAEIVTDSLNGWQ